MSNNYFYSNISLGSKQFAKKEITGLKYKGRVLYVKLGEESISLSDYLYNISETLERLKNFSFVKIPLSEIMYFSARLNLNGGNTEQLDAREALRNVKNCVIICRSVNGDDKISLYQSGDIYTALRVLRQLLPGKEYK